MTLDFTYILDQSPPTIHVVSPALSSSLPDQDSVILEVSDTLSEVLEVRANGQVAERRGALWLIEEVHFEHDNPALVLEASDEAGNLISFSESVTLSPLVWQSPDRLGAPSRGLLLSSGGLSPDSGVNLGPKSPFWSADFTQVLSLSPCIMWMITLALQCSVQPLNKA